MDPPSVSEHETESRKAEYYEMLDETQSGRDQGKMLINGSVSF